MPRRIDWTERQDETLRLMRRRGKGWEEIAGMLGMSRNATMERARALHALIERVGGGGEAVVDPDRRPLPPGHAVSWGRDGAGDQPGG